MTPNDWLSNAIGILVALACTSLVLCILFQFGDLLPWPVWAVIAFALTFGGTLWWYGRRKRQ